jgi:hypothetical protein
VRVIILPNNLFNASGVDVERLARIEKRWRTLLFTSASLGVLFGVTGLTLGALSLLGLPDDSARFGQTGMWLVGAFIPLMLFAAHAMDKTQAARKAARMERAKKRGYEWEGPVNVNASGLPQRAVAYPAR